MESNLVMNELLKLKLYAVRNHSGAYFHRKGYNGYGETWTNVPAKIRIYTKIGQARSIVTFFANHYKNHPIPYLVEITLGSVKILSEVDRVSKAMKKKEKEISDRIIRQKQYDISRAKQQLAEAQNQLKKLGE